MVISWLKDRITVISWFVFQESDSNWGWAIMNLGFWNAYGFANWVLMLRKAVWYWKEFLQSEVERKYSGKKCKKVSKIVTGCSQKTLETDSISNHAMGSAWGCQSILAWKYVILHSKWRNTCFTVWLKFYVPEVLNVHVNESKKKIYFF